MRRERRAAALALAAVLAGTAAFPASAAVQAAREPAEAGKSAAELNGYTEERWAALMDNRLEYDEIDELVHSFNPAIVSAWSGFTDNIRLMQTIRDNLHARQRDMRQLKENAKAAGDQADYGNYAMQEAILSATAKGIGASADKLSREVSASNRSLRVAERQVSVAAKRLMISYNGLRTQRAIASESATLYRRLRDDAAQRLSLGLGTALDLSSAETALMRAESQLVSLDAGAAKLKKSLILLCGWKEDADPEIGETPAADAARLEGMDPETDLRAAIAKNGTLIDFRNASHVKSTTSWELRADSEEAMNQNLLVNLREMQQDALAKQARLDAAQSGMQAAELSKDAAELQYRMGMLSVSAYLGALKQYQAARTELNTADSSFFEALELYDWALQGNSSVE